MLILTHQRNHTGKPKTGFVLTIIKFTDIKSNMFIIGIITGKT